MDTTTLRRREPTAITHTAAAVLPEPLPPLAPSDVISHETAARLHGMPVLGATGETPLHVSHPRRGAESAMLRRWRNPVLPCDRLTIGDLQITSPARTVIDLARDVGVIAGVLAADHLLRGAHDQEHARRELHTVADSQQRRNRFAQVRMVLHAATGEAVIPAESVLLAVLCGLGFTGFRQHVVLPGAEEPAAGAAVSFLFPRLRVVVDVSRTGESMQVLESAYESISALGYEVVAFDAEELLALAADPVMAGQLRDRVAVRLAPTLLADEFNRAAPGLHPTCAVGRT
ncbi:hypothetical protein [Brevibacterium luteolum]|uniref:hypothetical protein n=1 Tax=Brevibacterium luteolum TaxID=199591 RepID=UPI00223B739C|nr:hypothetical protein [Brevibacterium luteolum]MCT1655916.1 hypothetical protein [Brevibacterium luteolum]